ncbi:hypothetical protein ENTCAN_06785 [Enterobacter cancerogenus ATCC 35316]|nr:hypothetical protein ENTCAN_06785 [Enterobacter cancerogenus ATCC 35316]
MIVNFMNYHDVALRIHPLSPAGLNTRPAHRSRLFNICFICVYAQ